MVRILFDYVSNSLRLVAITLIKINKKTSSYRKLELLKAEGDDHKKLLKAPKH